MGHIHSTYYKTLLFLTLISFILVLFGFFASMLVGEEGLYIIHVPYLLFIVILILDCIYTWGVLETIVFFTSSFIIGLIFEIISVFYGIPFGKYYYTDVIPLKIFGIVPWSIPVYWFVVTYTAFSIVNYITNFRFMEGNLPVGITLTSILDGICSVSWDLLMDPVMVNVVHVWVWETKGIYFNIPLSNFIGWVVVAFIITVLYKIFTVKSVKNDPRLTHVPVVIYFELWLVMTIISINSGNLLFLPLGTFAMMTFVSLYVYKFLRERERKSYS